MPKPIPSVRLSSDEIDALIDELDSGENPGTSRNRRKNGRYSVRLKSCIIDVANPGGANSSYLVPTRNISATGMSFLSGAFLYPNTKCTAQLITLHGTWNVVTATVVRCAYVRDGVHEAAIRFEGKIDPSELCVDAVGCRILLVDDSPLIRRLAVHHLTSLNADVIEADCVNAALAAFENDNFDLVISDIEMPERSGFELLAELRGNGHTGEVVAITGMTTEEDRRRCLEAGFDQYFPKPLNKEMFVMLVESLRQEPIVSSLADDRSLTDIIKAFVEGLPEALREIEEVVMAGDRKHALRRLCDFRIAAGGTGFEPIADAALKVEGLISSDADKDSIERQVKNLIQLCRGVRPPV